LAIYQQSIDENQLADRKKRIKAMRDLYDKIPDISVALKVKILAQIRAEVGQDQPIQHVHTVHVGVNITPRAETYEEWLDQNQLVVHEARSKAMIDDHEDVSPRTGRATGSRLLPQLRR
jgi:hypothetical protein